MGIPTICWRVVFNDWKYAFSMSNVDIYILIRADPAWSCSPTPGKPVDVEFVLIVKAIQTIDAQRGTASVILEINLHWVDPRVARACARIHSTG